MKVKVADVTVTTREVDLPASCPKCGHNTKNIWVGYFDEHCGRGVIDNGDLAAFDDGNDFEESTDETHWRCAGCGFEFADGAFIVDGEVRRAPTAMGSAL